MPVDRDLTDFVAWYPKAPEKWWRLYGDAPFLNPDAIEESVHRLTPLYIWSSPAAWVTGGQRGIVILDPKIDLVWHLRDVRRVSIDTQALIDQIERSFRPPMPEMRVTNITDVAA